MTGAAPCEPRIDDGGFPGRTALVLARERATYEPFVAQLLGRGKSEPTGAAAELTTALLEAGLRSGGPTELVAAAFLAGRCDPGDDEASAHIGELLEELVEDLDVDVEDLDSDARPLIEALFSLVLRGEGDDALPRLEALAADGGAGTTHDWLAAAYLAQLGDGSGWPAMLAALGNIDAHTRLMATRHLAYFLPYDGQVVAGETVDVRARLVERLDDRDAYVAREVPGCSPRPASRTCSPSCATPPSAAGTPRCARRPRTCSTTSNPRADHRDTSSGRRDEVLMSGSCQPRGPRDGGPPERNPTCDSRAPSRPACSA